MKKPIEEDRFFSVLDFFFKNFAVKKAITVNCDRIDETIAIDDICGLKHRSTIKISKNSLTLDLVHEKNSGRGWNILRAVGEYSRNNVD